MKPRDVFNFVRNLARIAKMPLCKPPPMKIHSLAILLCSVVAVASFAQPAETATAPKKSAPRNPAFEKVVDDPKLPRVLLVGDSISIGYTLPVRTLLKGKANVHRVPENGGPTTNGLAKLSAWLGNGKWDVIHFNFGLHDLKL